MLSLIEIIQRSNEKDSNSAEPSLSLSNKGGEDENNKILDINKQQQDKVVKPRKPRQDKSLKSLQQTENLIENFSLISNTSSNCGTIIGASGSISSVGEPSRSSSSIDTGSCNTDELLIASNSSPDSPINQNDSNDLSCSSRRSSISNNDIGLDVELEQIMINNLDYLPGDNSSIKPDDDLVTNKKTDITSPKTKTKQFNNNNNKKQSRQPNYCNRNRRSRIVRTPLPPQPAFDTDNRTNGFQNENEKIDALTNEYKLTTNSNQEINHTNNADLGINDYILANNDTNNLEDQPNKDTNKRVNNLANNINKQSQNWPCYFEQPKSATNSNNQLMNEISKRRKKWALINPNSEPTNNNSTNSSSNSSGNELSDNPSLVKPKQLQKNINQKIQQLQSQQQPQPQQADYPVFKYLSKSLMNNLFTKDSNNSNSSSSCNSSIESNKNFKLNPKKQNTKTEVSSAIETTKPVNDLNSTTNTSVINNIKKHSTSNYNYLINKYSTLTSSASSLTSATSTPIINSTSTSNSLLKTNLKEANPNINIYNINNNNKEEINPVIISIIKDLVSDVIDSLDKKKINNNNTLATTATITTTTTKPLFFNNRIFKSEIESAAKSNVTNVTIESIEKKPSSASNFKLNNKPAPLIKTLINDITQLNKINSNSAKSCTDLDQMKNTLSTSSSSSLPITNEIDVSLDIINNNLNIEDDADIDSDSTEDVVNLADNALLININYEMENIETATNINNIINNKEANSITKSNDNQICDEIANCDKKITNQISNEKIIIIKSNTNNNDNFIINKAFVYASNINESNKVKANNNDDCCNNNNNEIIKSNDPNDLSDFNNYNNNNYAKLNNYKEEYAEVEVNLKKEDNNNINNECSNNNNNSNDLELNINIQAQNENEHNTINIKASDNNLQDIIQYPSSESTTTATTTKSKIFLINSNSNNLDENKISTIEINSDMTDLVENIKKNTKQTDLIKSGQANTAVLNQSEDDDSTTTSNHVNLKKDDDQDNNDNDDDKIPNDPPPPPPPALISLLNNDSHPTTSSESDSTMTQTTTPQVNCETEIENDDCNFIKIEDTKTEEANQNSCNNNNNNNNENRENEKISINLSDCSNSSGCNSEEKLNSNNLINDKNCNYSDQIILSNNTNNICGVDLDEKKISVEDKYTIENSNNQKEERDVESVLENKYENKEIEIDLIKQKEEQEGFMFAISSNEQNDKLVNKSNNENNANSNNNNKNNNENGLLLLSKECNNNNNKNNNSNNEITSKLEFELFSKQQETINNITYNMSTNNNNVKNNDSMNNLQHKEVIEEKKEGETKQYEEHEQPSPSNINKQDEIKHFDNDPDLKINSNNNINLNEEKMNPENATNLTEATATAVLSTLQTTATLEEDNQKQDMTQSNDASIEVVNNLSANEFEYLGNNITRVKLKSKEIVLIENCVDEDEKELDRLIKSKSINTVDLFYNPNASTPSSRKKASDLFASKSSTYFSTSLSSDRKHRSSKTDHSNSSNDDDDDPYVKAALERFDAFCRSKSSHSLDKGSSSANTPAPAAPSAAQLINNRNKSPFLTRKTITNPEEDQNLKDNIGSFIKRRQARVDPASGIPPPVPASNKTEPTNITNFTGSTPDIEKVQSTSPPPQVNSKFLNRSCSETRTFDDNKISTKSMSLNSHANPLSSSSLAKRFLGSLTPQLEPALETAASLDLDEKCFENTINNTINTAINHPEKPPVKEIVNNKEQNSSVSNGNTVKTEVIIVPKRRQAVTHQTRPSSAGAELSSHQNNSINNYRTNNNKTAKEEKVFDSFNDKKHGGDASISLPSSPSPGSNSKSKNVNIIKLEVVNKTKQRNEEKSVSPPHDKMNLKPPLPPTSSPPSPPVQHSNNVATSNNNSNAASNGSASHSTSWRSKLKNIYNEAPIIDGNAKSSSSSASSLSSSSSNEVTSVPTKPMKPGTRMIPLEVKNQKTGTVTIVKPNQNTNGRSNSLSSSSSSSSSSSNKKDSNFNVTPPVSASTIQKNGFLSNSSNTGSSDRVRSVSSYRPSSASETSSSQPSGSSLRNSSSFTYRDLSPSGKNTSGRALSSSSFHSDTRPRNNFINADDNGASSTNEENGSESPDPIAEKACNNFMHKLMEMQRQYKPPYSSTGQLPSSQTSSITEQSNLSSTQSSYVAPIVSTRVNNLYSDLYKNKSNENISGSSVAPAASASTYPYSSYLYNSSYNTPTTTSNTSSTTLPAAGVLDSLLSTTNTNNANLISSSSSSSLLNSENSSSSVAVSSEPPRPYVSAIRKRRTLFSDDSSELSDLSAIDSNMASTISYFTNKNFTSPYTNEYKSPYSSLLASTSSSAILNKSGYGSNSNLNAKPNNDLTNNQAATSSSHNFGRNRPLSIVNEESNNNNSNNANNNNMQTNSHYPTLTRSLSAKDSRSSTNNETNNFKDDNSSTSLMISNTPSQKAKQAIQLKKSNSINTSTAVRAEEHTPQMPLTSSNTTTQQKLRSTVFDRLAALNNTNINPNSNIMTKSTDGTRNVPANKLTTQKSNSNSCWQLNLSSPTPGSRDTMTESSCLSQPRRNSIDKTIGDLTQKNMTTIIKDQNEIAIVTSVVPTKRTTNNNQNNESGSTSSSSSSSLSRIRSLDSKSREKLRSNKDLKKSNVNLSTSISSAINQQSPTLPPTGSSYSKSIKSENESNSNNRRKSSISNGVTLPINNNCFNSSSNPSFSSTKTQVADNCLSKKDVFERLSKRTNSMKNLAAGINKISRSTGSPSSSDRENDGKISPHSTSSDEQVSTSNLDSHHHNNNHNNSISKTSVFERLYKSNIAAHMNHQAALLNDSQQPIATQSNVNNLKKNMSLSSANLISSLNMSTPTTLKKLNQTRQQPPQHQQRLFTKSTTKLNASNRNQLDENLKQKQEDSENDEVYRHFSNANMTKNYDGDDSNDDSNKNTTPISSTTTMSAPFILSKNDESNQPQQFVF